ncbi:hypothetical protein GEMRC1_003603 [Eukaryota sp. GEM-RC1]
MNYEPGSFILAAPSSDDDAPDDQSDLFIDLSDDVVAPSNNSCIMDIPVLPPNTNDIHDYLETLKEHSFNQGFVLRLFRSKYESASSYVKFQRIHGSRGSVSSVSGIRSHSSFNTDCMFFLVFRKDRHSEKWYTDAVNSNLHHNHQPCDDMSIYPQFRRYTFTPELKELAVYMIQSWFPADQIVDCIRLKDPGCRITPQDVHNLKGSVSQSLGLKPSVEDLITRLHQQSFHVSLLWDESDHVTHFLFLHKKSLNFYAKFHTVVQVDCTYKTEGNHLPLLAIVGTTPTLLTYHVGFCYMKAETTVDYRWVLSELRRICPAIPEAFVSDQETALKNALSEIYPESNQILCLWHICQNIQRHCQKRFNSGSDFNHFMHKFLNLVNLQEVDSFEEKYELFQSEFESVPAALRYIDNQWIPFKESF